MNYLNMETLFVLTSNAEISSSINNTELHLRERTEADIGTTEIRPQIPFLLPINKK